MEKPSPQVMCDRCERKYNPLAYQKCPDCNSVMKRPKWEHAKRWVSRNLAVVAMIKYGSKNELMPAFTNFYYDADNAELKRNKIGFKNKESLEKALDALNEIVQFVGWKTKIEHAAGLKEKKEISQKTDKEIMDLVKQYPSTLIDVLKNFDPEVLQDDFNLALTKDLIQNLNQGIFKTEAQVKISFNRVLKRLSKQDKQAMDELSELLETNSLLELTSVSRILMSRLNTLEIFEAMIHNEQIYEVQGDNSIQSRLEKNMWILNEGWWLIQANKSLKQFIGDQIAKQEGRKRPDFVCVTFEGELIIVDIKRPSHSIERADIDQVEEYKLIAKDYTGENFKSIKCYVIGKKIPPKSRNIANERRNIRLLTYNDLIESVKRKYVQYLDALRKAREATNSKT